MAGPARTLGTGGWKLVHDRWSAPLADAIVFHLPTLDPASLPVGRRPGPALGRVVDGERGLLPGARGCGVHVAVRPDDELPARRRRLGPRPAGGRAAARAGGGQDLRSSACRRPRVERERPERAGTRTSPSSSAAPARSDCYGACHRNRTLADDDGQAAKLATIARYRFTLAFENSIARDYVTEKLMSALIAGSGAGRAGRAQRRRVRSRGPELRRRERFSVARRPRVVSRRARGRRAALCGVPRVEVRRIPPRVSRHALVSVETDPWTRLARRLAG